MSIVKLPDGVRGPLYIKCTPETVFVVQEADPFHTDIYIAMPTVSCAWNVECPVETVMELLLEID